MSSSPQWCEIEFGGRRLRVPAVKSQGRLWFHWLGETHVVDVNAGTRRGGGEKSKSHPGVITAPMPGKITKVNVSAGEKVKKGQALVVMEAMKMEYTLEADLDGVVKECNVEAGRQVALGAVLVRLGGES
jgi:acetyl/propionyl-CoA carboxylase alpha subunit